MLSALSSLLLLPLASSASSASYPGALCNVTYSLPVPCAEATSRLAAQLDLWNEESSCPGQCEKVPPLLFHDLTPHLSGMGWSHRGGLPWCRSSCRAVARSAPSETLCHLTQIGILQIM